MQLFSIEYYATLFPERIGQQFNKTHTNFFLPRVLNFFVAVTSLVNRTYLKQECLKEMIDDLVDLRACHSLKNIFAATPGVFSVIFQNPTGSGSMQ